MVKYVNAVDFESNHYFKKKFSNGLTAYFFEVRIHDNFASYLIKYSFKGLCYLSFYTIGSLPLFPKEHYHGLINPQL